MFEKCFNRPYDSVEFPYFVPREELDYNREYAQRMIQEKWVDYRWREDVDRGGWRRNQEAAQRIAAHGGRILEICAGPGGGFVPATLMTDYDAHIMISDLCPAVVREWQRLFREMDNPPPNVEFAALNVCDLPFADNSLDVVSGNGAIINIEGDRDKALREIYRVLKPGGLFVFDFLYVTEDYYKTMPVHAREIIKKRYPGIFWDTLDIFDSLGFSQTQTVAQGEWSNKGDESTLADLCRSLGVEIVFSGFLRYCVK